MSQAILSAVAAALLVFHAAPGRAAPVPDLPPQTGRVLDIRMPPAGVTQQLTLSDGSVLYGRIESMTPDAIVFRSIAGAVLTVARGDIVDLREARGRLVDGEFQPADPHNTRLFFAPTARALRKGEGYAGVYEVFLPFAQVGITDRFSIGGGTPLVFGGGGAHPVWVTPKLQVLARDTTQAAVGVIHITGTGDHDAGIAYGVTTVGTPEKAATVGLGYAYSGHARTAIVMVGGEYRASRHIKWMTENWIWHGGDGFVSGGVRFLGEHLSADIGLVVPLVDSPLAFPIVSFAWHF